MRNFYQMQEAASYNQDAAKLPKAEVWDLFALKDGMSMTEAVPKFKTIRVSMDDGSIHFVSCPRGRYRLKQHIDAFNPITEGMTLAGIPDWKYVMWATPNRASLNVFVGSPGLDGVSIGFSISNSYDSSQTLRYGFSMRHTARSLELVGYRLKCTNGMKIRVPLNQASIIQLEVVEKVKKLFGEYTSIKHTKSMDEKVKAMQYVAEALSLLQQPVENMIKAGIMWKIDSEDKLKSLIKTHVGKRFKARVLEHYEQDGEGNDLWGLYNAMTAAASHDEDLKPSSREALLNKAAQMLMVEVSQ